MNLIAYVPASYSAERRYITQTLLGRFLGQSIALVPQERDDSVIQLQDDPRRQVVLADGLFATSQDKWLTEETVPRQIAGSWIVRGALARGLRHEAVPVLFGSQFPNGDFSDVTGDRVCISADLLGGAFFLLTRYEELAWPSPDSRERYPAVASLMHRAGLLSRPIVNEYSVVLWNALTHLWPGLRRSERQYRVLPTHDVDRPFCVYGRTFAQIARQTAGDLFRRHEPGLALARLHSAWRVRTKGPQADICNNFDWMMAESERRGLRSAFYFLHKSSNPIDSDYEFCDDPILDIMRSMKRRGHEIGLHPTYNSFRSAKVIAEEHSALRKAADRVGVQQDRWGGRQHYLRWEAPATWQHWADAGLDYDSTVGFADAAGFRCGTCFEFPVFNLRTREELRLVERPLVAMEASLLPDGCGARVHAEALRLMKDLADECRHHSGDFVLLWHNGRLLSRRDRDTYLAILDYAVGASRRDE